MAKMEMDCNLNKARGDTPILVYGYGFQAVRCGIGFSNKGVLV